MMNIWNNNIGENRKLVVRKKYWELPGDDFDVDSIYSVMTEVLLWSNM